MMSLSVCCHTTRMFQHVNINFIPLMYSLRKVTLNYHHWLLFFTVSYYYCLCFKSHIPAVIVVITAYI